MLWGINSQRGNLVERSLQRAPAAARIPSIYTRFARSVMLDVRMRNP